MSPNIFSSLFSRRSETDSLDLSPLEVETLLLKLISEHYEDLESLRNALQQIKQQRSTLVKDVANLLKYRDPNARMYATLALGLLGDNQAIPHLIGALEDTNASTRYNAIEALGRLKARQAVDPLLRMLREANQFDATTVINALGRIGDPRVLPEMLTRLNTPALSEAVITALGNLGTIETVPVITAQLDKENISPLITSSTLAAIFERSGPKGKAIKEQFLRKLTPTGRMRLLSAVPAYSPYVMTKNETGLSAGLAVVLGWLLEANPDTLEISDALIGLLNYQITMQPAANVLAHYDPALLPQLLGENSGLDMEAREALLKSLIEAKNRETVPVLIEALDLNDAPLVTLAAEGLATLADPSSFDAILDHLNDASLQVRHALLHAINVIPVDDKAGRLLALLGSSDRYVRDSALRALFNGDYPEAAPAVLGALVDPSNTVRRTAIELLPGVSDPRIPEILAKALTVNDQTIRAAAARSMSRMPVDVAAPALVRALKDEDFYVRLYACRSLAVLASPASVPALCALLEDPMPPIRLSALDALSRIKSQKSLGPIRRLLNHPDPDFREAAQEAIKEIENV